MLIEADARRFISDAIEIEKELKRIDEQIRNKSIIIQTIQNKNKRRLNALRAQHRKTSQNKPNK